MSAEAAARQSEAEFILRESTGILRARSWRMVDGAEQPYIVYRVIVDGHQVGLWTKRRWARRDLRGHLRKRGR